MLVALRVWIRAGSRASERHKMAAVKTSEQWVTAGWRGGLPPGGCPVQWRAELNNKQLRPPTLLFLLWPSSALFFSGALFPNFFCGKMLCLLCKERDLALQCIFSALPPVWNEFRAPAYLCCGKMRRGRNYYRTESSILRLLSRIKVAISSKLSIRTYCFKSVYTAAGNEIRRLYTLIKFKTKNRFQ